MILAYGFKAQTGKDSSGDYLRDNYGFVKDSFAHSLKEGIGKHVFGLTEWQMETKEGKETVDAFWGITPREILQKAGTEAMREIFGADIWIRTLQRRVLTHPDQHIAVTDVRYPNEAEAIKSMGGLVINIHRGIEGTALSGHKSETQMDSYDAWDAVIDNNGSFTDLYNQIDRIVKDYSILALLSKKRKAI